MKKLIAILCLFALATISFPQKSLAAGGIFASGGGTKTVGQSFTVTVTASGATFDTIHGAISVSGPVTVTSFSYGDATWMSKPSNGGTFDGAFLGQKQTSFTVATIKLRGDSPGTGAVTVSGASLKNAGSVVGTGSSNASFTIEKAPDLPGAVKVSSSSHSDQNASYEATAIVLSWVKDSGVDGFSYLLDQVAATTPAAKTTDANTSVTYSDKAVGTYYFHIRAHKPDGWGAATHFKINIKEPDAKINETLSKPNNIIISKNSDFENNIENGTITGITISGISESGFTAVVTLTPKPTIPDGKLLSAIADAAGKFNIVIDYPIAAGFHTMTIQGQKDKVLTPISDLITFEISQAKGGTINILTSADEIAPVVTTQTQPEKKSLIDKIKQLNQRTITYFGSALIILIIILSFLFFMTKNRKSKKLAKELNIKK